MRPIHERLICGLSELQKSALEKLLKNRESNGKSNLNWLKQSPVAVNSKHLLEHISRLKMIRDIGLHPDTGKDIHQNRLLKMAREGRYMTTQHLSDLEKNRRLATLTAVLLDLKATIIDEIIEMHDKIIGSMFKYAKNTQNQLLQKSEKSINDQLNLYLKIGSTLLAAKQAGTDAFEAIESIISWEDFYLM